MANVLWTDGPKVAYVASDATPPRGTKGRRRARRRACRSSGSGISKSGGPPPRSISLGSGSGLLIRRGQIRSGQISHHGEILRYDIRIGRSESVRSKVYFEHY